MPETKNTFTGSRMDKDADSRLLERGLYRDALNFKSANSEGDHEGAGENALSNKQLTSLSLGANVNTLGMFMATAIDRIYWFLSSDSGNFVVEYDIDSDSSAIVLHDTRVGVLNILNFDINYLITGVNIIVNSDDGTLLLCWTDGLNEPKCINIDRAKSYGENGFDEADIRVIKAPPIFSPVINLVDSVSNEENDISERFLRFAYRYQYLDGEYSAISPFTETAFLPKTFSYDYAISSNESMVNTFNEVNINFNTGSDLVKVVEIVFKESGSSNINVIESYIKDDQGWADDASVTVDYNNNKVKQVLDESQLARIYDAVPLKAKAQEMISNRIIYGFYTENYNIEDSNGARIPIDFSLSADNTAIVSGTPTQSMKSNRDYEIGISYLDGKGRMSTILTSINNTAVIPNPDCINQNQLKATIVNLAPFWATNYRFFIKQTREDYDVVVPTLFYADGVYVWIKLEGDEVNKITEGEFLYVKADTQEILGSTVQTRVLEIKTQDANFLGGGELGGTYFRVKPSGYRINEDDFIFYEFNSYDSSSNANDNPIRSEVNVIEKASYYGTSGLNDLTSSGTYSGTVDVRYIVRIFSTGAPDTYEWSDDDGATFDDNGAAGYAITGGAQLIQNGVQVTFAATTGHAASDTWIVSAKSATDDGFGGSEGSKAYAFFKSLESNGNINVDDVIEGGARITIVYDEYNETTEFEEHSFISSRKYDNLEEWFFGDSIQAELTIAASRIWFRRGTTTQNGGAKYFTQDATADMTMIIISSGTQNNDLDQRVKVRSTLEIFQSEQNIIFETIPTNNDSAFFFEIGRTYAIDSSGFHLGFDGSDTDQSGIADAVLILPVFNCFSWGNGFESYKIKDLFNAKSMKTDSRPLDTIEDYRENIRISSLTYSQPYEQTTNYNGINEFNLSKVNWKDMDDKYESVQKLFSRDTNLIVFQEDKIHNIPFAKDILFDADGNGNVKESNEVLGTEIAFSGEWGISKNPESFAFYGNQVYFTDSTRGAVLRLGLDGIEEISKRGMRDYFRDSFRDVKDAKKIGAYDLFNKQYVLTVDDVFTPETMVMPCGSTINAYAMDEALTFDVTIQASTGNVFFNYVATGNINLTITEAGVPTDAGTITGTSSYEYNKTSSTIEVLTVTLTPIATTPNISLTIPCPIDAGVPIIANDDLVLVLTGTVVDNINILDNDVFIDPVTVLITTPPVEGTAIVNPNNTIKYTHAGLNTNADTLIYNIDDGSTNDSADLDLNVKATGGGGGATGQVFSISTDSYYNPAVDGEGACGFVLDDTKYHDGALLEPKIGDNVFTDINKTTPFNGGDKYYRISNGISIRIFTDGSITGYWVCGAGEA